MSHRVIRGLVHSWPCSRPSGLPVGRPRGAKAAGLRYEQALARALPDALHGQWFGFRDASGLGHCQPDLLLALDARETLVIEVKYTWVSEARGQIERLYRPVVEHATGRRVHGLVVCKVLVPEAERQACVVGSLTEAIALARLGKPTVLHWLGVGQLGWRVPAPTPAPSLPSHLSLAAL